MMILIILHNINITNFNITTIILEFPETWHFEVRAKHSDPALIPVITETFASGFH